MEYNSPVDEAFESAPAFREGIAKVLRGELVDPNLFHSLAQEYNRQICGGEYWHKATTELLFAPRLSKMGPFMRTYITKARCPVTKMLITERKIIGEDIPEPEYTNVIESPDLMLSERYPPHCEPCSTALRTSTTHPAIIGFTRYIPKAKRHLFRALHEANAAYYNMEGHHAWSGTHLTEGMEDVIQSMHTESEDRIAAAELEFRRNLFENPGDMFVETRIKGHERLREKLKRSIAATYTEKQMPQVTDVYGTRFVAATRSDVEEIIFSIKDEIRQFQGEDWLIPAPEQLRFKGDQYIYEVNKNTHYSLRLTTRFGPQRFRSRLSIHGMSIDDWFIDQDTHVPYEETQRATLLTLTQINPEVKRACDTIDEIFNQLGRLS